MGVIQDIQAPFKRRAKVVPNLIQFGSTVARHWHDLVQTSSHGRA